MRLFFAFLLLLSSSLWVQAQTGITSPEEFLGYPLGSRFTRHHRVVDYFNLLESEAQGRMKIVPYGKTNEGRPLFTAILSSQRNMDRLEEIRMNNLRRSGFEQGETRDLSVGIVWLSYNVHGDEPVSTEAALKTIHKLLDLADTESQAWLENTVVIMDPCINPDGRERYVQFYSQFRQEPESLYAASFSHNPYWPAGRTNHYFFDLNRDWVWQSQLETKQRLELYHDWMPHIHVDFHEQGFNSPYYFAPGAEPYHNVITDWQRNFQIEIGKNHAKYFDRNYWSYFTGEVFDLLYPSYGDTYPTFNGAIGMTYEQGGGRAAGTGVITEYGDTLTLADRIEHHYTTGFSTVEIASVNSAKLESEFGKYFQDTQEGPYTSYLVSGSNDPGKLDKLIALLNKHRIRYGVRTGSKTLKGVGFTNSIETEITLHSEDLVIPVNQPKGRLITALFEPKTFVFDSLTYDLTAWNLPIAYGLEGAALTSVPSFSEDSKSTPPVAVSGTDYGYLLPYTSLNDGKALATMIDKSVKVAVADKSFEMDNTHYPAGTLVILNGNNSSVNLGEVLNDVQKKHHVQFVAVSTGFTPKGIDLGSNQVRKLTKKRVALLAGESTNANNVGEIWFFLEKELQYPMTMLNVAMLNRVDLSKYDVIIVPEGRYAGLSSELDTLREWVREGGQLITFGRAVSEFSDEEGSAISTIEDTPEEQEKTFVQVGQFGNRQRNAANRSIPGAIFEVTLDNSHPLAYGYPNRYYTLKTNAFGPVRFTSGQVVGQIPENMAPINGFAGRDALKKLSNSVVFGVVNSGKGKIIVLTDNPLYRSFWENGKLIVVNALFMN